MRCSRESRRLDVATKIGIALGVVSLFGQIGCKDRAVTGGHPAQAQVGPAAGRKLAFNESIEPILSENCYACHGPDPGARKAGLRLDRGEFAFAPHEKSGPAIIPGDPVRSPFIQRVESADPKRKMPPAEAHKTLLPAQIALLRRWIEEGAAYEELTWSFIPPKRPAVPATKRTDWAQNPIDSFILARLEREGLEPAPEADRYTLDPPWVTYDLTRASPHAEEAEAPARRTLRPEPV